jgi:hypothetical protein
MNVYLALNKERELQGCFLDRENAEACIAGTEGGYIDPMHITDVLPPKAEPQPASTNISRDAIASLLDNIEYWQRKKIGRQFIIDKMIEKISIAQQHPC